MISLYLPTLWLLLITLFIISRDLISLYLPTHWLLLITLFIVSRDLISLYLPTLWLLLITLFIISRDLISLYLSTLWLLLITLFRVSRDNNSSILRKSWICEIDYAEYNKTVYYYWVYKCLNKLNLCFHTWSSNTIMTHATLHMYINMMLLHIYLFAFPPFFRLWQYSSKDVLGPVGMYCVRYTRNPSDAIVSG